MNMSASDAGGAASGPQAASGGNGGFRDKIASGAAGRVGFGGWALACLLKQAFAKAVPAAWTMPFTDRTPHALTLDDRRYLETLKARLPPSRQGVVGAGQQARGKADKWLS